MKKLYLFGACLLIIGILIIYHQFDPNKYSFFPQCPFHQLTGFDCPGCGSQRALHQLLVGNVAMAMHYNILLVLSIPFLLIHFGYKLTSLIKHKNISWGVIYHPATPKIIFLLVTLFFVLRNVPVYPFIYFKV